MQRARFTAIEVFAAVVSAVYLAYYAAAGRVRRNYAGR